MFQNHRKIEVLQKETEMMMNIENKNILKCFDHFEEKRGRKTRY